MSLYQEFCECARKAIQEWKDGKASGKRVELPRAMFYASEYDWHVDADQDRAVIVELGTLARRNGTFEVKGEMFAEAKYFPTRRLGRSTSPLLADMLVGLRKLGFSSSSNAADPELVLREKLSGREIGRQVLYKVEYDSINMSMKRSPVVYLCFKPADGAMKKDE